MLSCAKITGLSKLRTQKLGLRPEKKQCREGDPLNLQVNYAQMLRGIAKPGMCSAHTKQLCWGFAGLLNDDMKGFYTYQ